MKSNPQIKCDSSRIRGVEIGRNRPKMTEYRSKRLDCSSARPKMAKRVTICIIVGRNSEFTGIRNRCTESLSGVTIGPLRACSAKKWLAVHRFRVTIGSQWPGLLNRWVHKKTDPTREHGS